MRILFTLVLLLAAVAGGVWFNAGRADGPSIEIAGSQQVGQIGNVTVAIDTPDGALKRIEVRLEQDGRVTELFKAGVRAEVSARGRGGVIRIPDGPPSTPSSSEAPPDEMVLLREGPDRLRLARSIGQATIPELEAGAAQIVVTAVRPVLFGMREATATVTREIEVRLTPPTLTALSRFHFINHGGSEMVVYRVSPADVDSGVRVGDHDYPGFPASGIGMEGADPALRVAFFALLPDQSTETSINLYARDALGNEGAGYFEYRVFPKVFRNSQIRLSDRFLARVVPAILDSPTELDVPDPSNLLESYLKINRDLRRTNNETIAALSEQTDSKILWRGPFKQLMNSAVEAGFADHRTYVYQGRPVDQQVHLGFDLASTAAAPVRAANAGRVLHAGWLGIYGNCVILDHGMGLQSLYAHLSTIDVASGDTVSADSVLGRSGATGLAGGDHLHFTMLLAGNAVTPIDWWSAQWVEDRVTRKWIEAGLVPPVPEAL